MTKATRDPLARAFQTSRAEKRREVRFWQLCEQAATDPSLIVRGEIGQRVVLTVPSGQIVGKVINDREGPVFEIEATSFGGHYTGAHVPVWTLFLPRLRNANPRLLTLWLEIKVACKEAIDKAVRDGGVITPLPKEESPVQDTFRGATIPEGKLHGVHFVGDYNGPKQILLSYGEGIHKMQLLRREENTRVVYTVLRVHDETHPLAVYLRGHVGGITVTVRQLFGFEDARDHDTKVVVEYLKMHVLPKLGVNPKFWESSIPGRIK